MADALTDASKRVTTTEAAELLGVPADTISKWRQRGRVVPVGLISGRRFDSPVYLLEELKPLAEAYYARAATRRERGQS